MTKAEVEERVAGRYRVWQHSPDGGSVGGFDCEIAELVLDRKLVFRWASSGRSGSPGHATTRC